MNAHKFAAAALLGVATATAIPTGTSGAQTAPTTCMVHVHPWDDMSRRLEVVHADGRTEVLLSVQDNRTTLGGERTFEVAATVRRIHWTWNRAAGAWRVDLGVGPGCAMEPYPFWQGGEHQPSLSMTVGQVPTTTTAPPATTTTRPTTTTTAPPPPVTTTAPAPTTTTPGATATSVVRVTPPPATPGEPIVVPTGTILPVTGRRTWAQVRLSIALALAGVAFLQLAQIMRQDNEMAEDEE